MLAVQNASTHLDQSHSNLDVLATTHSISPCRSPPILDHQASGQRRRSSEQDDLVVLETEEVLRQLEVPDLPEFP